MLLLGIFFTITNVRKVPEKDQSGSRQRWKLPNLRVCSADCQPGLQVSQAGQKFLHEICFFRQKIRFPISPAKIFETFSLFCPNFFSQWFEKS